MLRRVVGRDRVVHISAAGTTTAGGHRQPARRARGGPCASTGVAADIDSAGAATGVEARAQWRHRIVAGILGDCDRLARDRQRAAA